MQRENPARLNQTRLTLGLLRSITFSGSHCKRSEISCYGDGPQLKWSFFRGGPAHRYLSAQHHQSLAYWKLKLPRRQAGSCSLLNSKYVSSCKENNVQHSENGGLCVCMWSLMHGSQMSECYANVLNKPFKPTWWLMQSGFMNTIALSKGHPASFHCFSGKTYW